MTQPIFDERQGGYRVFVGNLASRANPAEFQKECERHGKLINCWVARDPPGFAFLVYKKAADASAAVISMNGSLFCGQPIRVEHARARLVDTRNSSNRDDDRTRRRSRRRSHSRSRSRSRSKNKSSRRRQRSSSSSGSSTSKHKRRSRSSSDRDRKHSRRHHHHRRRSSSNSHEKTSSTITTDNQSIPTNTKINNSN